MLLKTVFLAIFVVPLVQLEEDVSNNNWDDIPPRRGRCYEKEVLLEGTLPIHISVSHVTGNIYFIDSKSNLKVLKKGENLAEDINININKSVRKYMTPKTVMVDSFGPMVYIGCNKGMKIYYEYSGIIEDVPGINKDIDELYMPHDSGSMYVVTSTRPRYNYQVYKYNHIGSKGISLNLTVDRMFLTNFVVDSDGNYYFKRRKDRNTSVLKFMSNINSTEVEYEGGDRLNQMSLDNHGKVYAASSHHLYRLKPDNNIPQIVTSLDFFATAMCFDANNNLVFGSREAKSMVLLKLDLKCPSDCSDGFDEYYSPQPFYAPDWY